MVMVPPYTGVFAATVVVVVIVTACVVVVVVVVLLVQEVNNTDRTITATIRKLSPNPTQNCLLFTFFSFLLFLMQKPLCSGSPKIFWGGGYHTIQ